MIDDLTLDPFERTHEGRNAAFIVRRDHGHIETSREAIAYRMDIPVGFLRIDWNALREKKPGAVVKLARKAA